MKTWLLFSFLAGLMAACAQARPGPVPTDAATAMALPTQTPTVTASATLVPTATATPRPTSTPTPPLKQLTIGGCCVQPSWSDDSRRVLFVDKPASADTSGLYAVDTATGANQPPQKAGPVAFYSRDFSLITYLDKQKTTVESVSTGAKCVFQFLVRRPL